MKLIHLCRDRFAIIDDEDVAKVANRTWFLRKSDGYVSDNAGKYLSHIITNYTAEDYKEGKVVDHINNDKLDNRKCNLRIITNVENVAAKGIARRVLTPRGVRLYVDLDSVEDVNRYSDIINKDYLTRLGLYIDVPPCPPITLEQRRAAMEERNALLTKSKKPQKYVKVTRSDGVVFPSLTAAAKSIDGGRHGADRITECIQGNRVSYGGFQWRRWSEELDGEIVELSNSESI